MFKVISLSQRLITQKKYSSRCLKSLSTSFPNEQFFQEQAGSSSKTL